MEQRQRRARPTGPQEDAAAGGAPKTPQMPQQQEQQQQQRQQQQQEASPRLRNSGVRRRDRRTPNFQVNETGSAQRPAAIAAAAAAPPSQQQEAHQRQQQRPGSAITAAAAAVLLQCQRVCCSSSCCSRQQEQQQQQQLRSNKREKGARRHAGPADGLLRGAPADPRLLGAPWGPLRGPFLSAGLCVARGPTPSAAAAGGPGTHGRSAAEAAAKGAPCLRLCCSSSINSALLLPLLLLLLPPLLLLLSARRPKLPNAVAAAAAAEAAALAAPALAAAAASAASAAAAASWFWKMLTFGKAIEEVPLSKETILTVHVVQLTFNEAGLKLVDNKKKLSIAVMYKGEELPQACSDPRRVCYKVFRKKIDDTSVTLPVGCVFQLPFSSTFPVTSPSLEIYVMLESLFDLRKCVAGARISLGRRCRGLMFLSGFGDYSLFLGTNSTEHAGDLPSSSCRCSLLLLLLLLRGTKRTTERLNEEANSEQKLSQISGKQRRVGFTGFCFFCMQPISVDTVFDMKGLNLHIDRLLVQMQRDGVVVVPMISRLKAGDCSAARFASFFLDSHPYRILAKTPIPLFSAETVVRAWEAAVKERTAEHGFLGWDRCAGNAADFLIDRAALIDPQSVVSSHPKPEAALVVHRSVLATCEAVCFMSTFAFYAAQYAVQIIEEELLRPTADCLLLGSLPFDSIPRQDGGSGAAAAATAPTAAAAANAAAAPVAEDAAAAAAAAAGDKRDRSKEENELSPVRPVRLGETLSMFDKWREGFYFRRLPAGHPLGVFTLFKNDQLFVSRHVARHRRAGLLLAILVLGDENVDMEEASKLYGLEIQAQRMFNEAIVALKRRTASSFLQFGISPFAAAVAACVAAAAVDYKGFRVVVLPLPESVPEVLAWPQPLAARIRHEISFIETKLNVCSLLQPVDPKKPPRDRTVLLSLKSRGADTMMLYRTCFTLPPFSGMEGEEGSPRLSQRLRTVPFEFSAEVEMAVKSNRHLETHAPAKARSALKDPIVHSPFSRIYSEGENLVYFLTSKRERQAADGCEPIVCGRVLPGRKTRRLGTIVKSVVLHDVVAELERMDPYGPCDSISLTRHLHARGINMRLLGALYKGSRSQWLQHMLLVEIVARSLKQLLKTVLRSLVFATHADGSSSNSSSSSSSVSPCLRAKKEEVFYVFRLFPQALIALFSVSLLDLVFFPFSLRSFAAERQKTYTKESLLRESVLRLPLFVSTRLLDDSPYLLDFSKHQFRTFFWQDVVALNLFNVALGTCVESEEFWSGFLCHLCCKLYGVEASIVKKHRVFLPALYVSLQHHCGISFFPCAATFHSLLPRAFPLMPSHIRTWMPRLFRSLVVPSSLPIFCILHDPSKLPLACPSSSAIIASPSPAQMVLSRLIGHCLFQCSSPLWHASQDVSKGLGAKVLSSVFCTTQGHPLLISQDSWDAEESTIELIATAVRYEAWDVAQLLARSCVLQYPEAHAASVPVRLLLLLATTHGSREPPPRVELAAMSHGIQKVVLAHWGSHHPALLDVAVAQAWVSYLGRDWEACFSGLQAAVSLSGVLSVVVKPQDVSCLLRCLCLLQFAVYLQLPAGIPPAPVTPKMAGLLRMLAHCELVLVYSRRCSIRRDFMTTEQLHTVANRASMMLQWALDAYDFHFGARYELTMATAREFALSLLLLTELTGRDAGGSIVQRGVEIAFQTLEWQTNLLGKCHLETLSTGQLLAVLLAYQGNYRRCIDLYEALIRNAFTRRTHQPLLRGYRPDNEFSRVCWCLPDPYFYGIFETIGPKNRFFSKIRCFLPSLEDEQALMALDQQDQDLTGETVVVAFCLSAAATTEKAKEGLPENSKKNDLEERAKGKVIQLDPSDPPIFPSLQAKAASDILAPRIPTLVEDMFMVYINFAVKKKIISRLVSLFLLLDYLEKQSLKAVYSTEFEAAWTKAGGDTSSQSFLTWLLDLSSTSDMQVMEYIQHYPFRISKENLFDQDSDMVFLLCHPSAFFVFSADYTSHLSSKECLMDRYLMHLLEKSEAAISHISRLIFAGDAKRLAELAQSYSSPLEKMQRALSKVRVILLMLGSSLVGEQKSFFASAFACGCQTEGEEAVERAGQQNGVCSIVSEKHEQSDGIYQQQEVEILLFTTKHTNERHENNRSELEKANRSELEKAKE
ncbi:hypothetical protein Efla_002376 [Eimeria flavescens]